jgi:arylsulfatase A
LVEQGGPLAIIKDDWKYISSSQGEAYFNLTGIESGNDLTPQLYNLKDDIGEKNNLAEKYPDKVNELKKLLEKIKTKR